MSDHTDMLLTDILNLKFYTDSNEVADIQERLRFYYSKDELRHLKHKVQKLNAMIQYNIELCKKREQQASYRAERKALGKVK